VLDGLRVLGRLLGLRSRGELFGLGGLRRLGAIGLLVSGSVGRLFRMIHEVWVRLRAPVRQRLSKQAR
jgi:hypothetical protein